MESFFSKYDTCARKTDFSKLDDVRTGQYRSAESRKITAVNPTPQQIREAGKGRHNEARAVRLKTSTDGPKARDMRK